MRVFHRYRNFYWLLFAAAVVWGLSGCELLGSSDNGEEEEITIDLPGKIVFSMRAEDGNNQIFTINADGSDLVQRTFQDFEYEGETQFDFMGLYPSWNPEGDKIIFNSFTGFSALSIWIMESDSINTGYTIFNEHGSQVWGNHPKWHPNGTRIVYFRPNDFNDNPFIYDFDTQDVTSLGHQFTDESPNDFLPRFWYPNWNSSGTKLTFFSTLDAGWNIYVAKTDGTDLEKISSQSFHTPVPLIWHPSGEAVTFRAKSEYVDPGLYNLNVETGELSIIVDQEETGLILHPKAWSADGQFILVNNESDWSNHVLEILDVENLHPQEIYAAPSGSINGADWLIDP